MRQSVFRRPLLLALGLSTAFVMTAPSSAQNPVRPAGNTVSVIAPALDLVARDIATDRAAVSAKSLTIASLHVDVQIDGGLAQTTITARFTNPNNGVLEGDFTLSLPREAWVTGFALDVNGVLVDGVLQAKAKAAEAYEENLRRGVDPGLGEINSANQFRTRIFPINPQSGRTIKITYISTLDAAGTYTLPLTSAGAVGQVDVKISNQGNANPVVRLPSGLSKADPNGNLQANAAGSGGFYDGYGQTIAHFQGQNTSLRGDLKLSNLGGYNDVRVSSSATGDQYFTFVVPPAPITASKPKLIRLYWDTSRSRRDDDLAKEIALLERYIAQVGPERVDLVLFADGAPRTISLHRATMGTLARQLRDLRYQGASRFDELERTGQGEADVCLMFSDGQLTMDAFSVKTWPCKVITISTSLNARRDILEGIANANRGAFIDLKTASIADALVALVTRGPDIRSLKTETGTHVDYAINSMPDGNFRITGPKPNANQLVLQAYNGERVLSLQSAALSPHNGSAALWGVSQIKRLSATDNPDTDALLAAVRRFGVATPDYSFLVLETVEDYARNDITPPPGIGKDFLAQFQARRTQIEAVKQREKDARLQTILGQWNEQKVWWKTRFEPQAQVQAPAKALAGNANEQSQSRQENAPSPPRPVRPASPAPSLFVPRAVGPPAPPPPPPPPPPPRQDSRIDPASAPTPTSQEAITVTGTRMQRRVPTLAANIPLGQVQPSDQTSDQTTALPARSTITVTSATWNPDRPYLSALRDVKSGDEAAFETIYRAQEVRFGDTPAFYFDMAERAFRNGLQRRAASLAGNALELSNTSIDTKIILASRLVRYGGFAQAIWLNERILQATPNKPQALRNLALSIIDATDAREMRPDGSQAAAIAAYERALSLLMKIVLTPNNTDYDGIELIALMEANHVAAKLKSLGVSEERLATFIDPRLVTLMTVDIRVILEWNTDKTDIDLWVDEPTGERAIFNNPRTAIGGRLSNDMTRGYGPEEYLLNAAPDGLYKVLSNAYAADRLDPNGPTSLTVKLYRDWGRSTQKVESFVVELNKGRQNGTTQIGQFVKGPAVVVPPPSQ